MCNMSIIIRTDNGAGDEDDDGKKKEDAGQDRENCRTMETTTNFDGGYKENGDKTTDNAKEDDGNETAENYNMQTNNNGDDNGGEDCSKTKRPLDHCDRHNKTRGVHLHRVLRLRPTPQKAVYGRKQS